MKHLKSFLVSSLLSTLLLSSVFSFAQYEPKPGDKQIVLGVAGNNSLIMLRKYKTETVCNRYKLNLNYNINNYSDKNVNSGSRSENKNSSFGINGSFGKQKNFKINDKLIPYVALDLNIGFNYGQSNYTTSVYDSLAANKRQNDPIRRIISSTSTTKYENLNVSASLNPAIGFNYHINKSFAIGVEYQFNLVTSRFTVFNNREDKNESSYLFISNVNNQTTYTVVENKPDPSITKNEFSFGINGNFSGTGYITASYYF